MSTATLEPTHIVSHKHPETARAMEQKMLPRIGTYAEQAYRLIRESKDGLTDYDLEVMTGRTHQAISATRKLSLVDRGLVVDSGRQRMNQHGNFAIVWIDKERA